MRVMLLLGLSIVALVGCSSSKVNEPTGDANSDAEPICELIDTVQVERVMGAVELDPGATGPSGCTFVGGGPESPMLAVERIETPNAGAVDAVAESFGMVDVGGVDDQLFWTPSLGEHGYKMLVRRGGSAAVLTYTGVDETTVVRARLTDLAQRVAPTLPTLPFDNLTMVVSADCSAIDASAIASAAGVNVDELAVTSLSGTTGCALAIVGSGTSATVRFDSGPATPDTLRGAAETRTVGGTTIEIEGRPVDRVGEGAIWFADPSSDGSGELRSLADGRAFNVTVSGAADETAASTLAAAVANASIQAAG